MPDNRRLPTTPLALAALLAWSLAATPAGATSGFGCYRPNVGPGDALVVRATASAGGRAVTQIHSGSGEIVALDAPGLRGEHRQQSLLDVHRAEFALCTRASEPLGARWCPVRVFAGNATASGWIKRRFVDHNECP